MDMENFELEWTNKDGSKEKKKLIRSDMYDLMLRIKKIFSGNNEFATKFVEIIPSISSMKINKKRNEDIDVPFIVYVIDGKEEVLQIPRCNKIIWGVLNELTK